MTKLEKINELLQEAIHEHVAIRTLNEISHVKSAAKRLAELNAEIEILKAGKTREIEKIEAEKRKEKNRQRRRYLKKLAPNIEAAITESARLADDVNQLIYQLVQTLMKRESVFSASAIGLFLPEHDSLLTAYELKSLSSTRERSIHSVSRGEFAVSWRHAVEQACKDEPRVRDLLLRLIEPLSDHHTTPIAGANAFLADEVRRLPKDFPNEPEAEKPAPETKDNATHIVADLRPPPNKDA